MLAHPLAISRSVSYPRQVTLPEYGQRHCSHVIPRHAILVSLSVVQSQLPCLQTLLRGLRIDRN